MDNVFTNPWLLVIGVGGVIALRTLGVKALEPKTSSSRMVLWVAFAVEALCGLLLGAALYQVTRWLTSLTGRGEILGAIGSIIALTFGWHAVKLIVVLIRDLADGKPDKDARHAALLVPTLLPPGFAAVAALVSNPRGLGGGVAAAVMAGITLYYCLSISKLVLGSQKHKVPWKWFALAVHVLAGLVITTAVVYIDGLLAEWLSPGWMLAVRLVGGFVGLGLAIAAVADIADKEPDQHARRLAAFGQPLLSLFGSAAIAWINTNANSGLDLITGVA
ncbi:hypothetical protein E1091_01545 [Micromonospora fluostatini]|uniref:Uncharacterized protein n=1 Tax=Micromonospora fluostatini TaxID=1629071 RepID=A0ABY2DLG1_9ACTN|nr:hypothetical protein E1091_01545 [Micromonospora fluostatini]